MSSRSTARALGSITLALFMRGAVIHADERVEWQPPSAPAQAATADAGKWIGIPPPPGRWEHTAIYDPVRDRMLVFGGADGSLPPFDDVWALSLSGTSTWSSVATSGAPVGRQGHSAIYDPVRDRMVIFGGSGNGLHNDVRVLALSGIPTWSYLSPTGTLPPKRLWHSAIYDSARDRLIVFGGSDGNSSLGDVWALSLSGTPAWNRLDPSGTPPAGRFAHTAIYDPVRERMVVFGGAAGGYLNDVWALSLSGNPTWIALSPTGTPPSARCFHTATYDRLRDRMVIFGGEGKYKDAWALSLSGIPEWSALSPSGIPGSGGYASAAIHDPVRDRIVVFGGYDGTRRNDAWALSLAGSLAWSAIGAPGTPLLSRGRHTAIYSPDGRMVVFGGFYEDWNQDDPLNDLWALSLSGSPTWSPINPSGPVPLGRTGHTAIYDPVRHRMVVFGGAGAANNEVLALPLSGSPAWSVLLPAGTTGTQPIGRYGHTAIYDRVRDRMIIFGGYAGPSSLSDTWALSLSGEPAWSALPSCPSPRSDHSAIYDPVRDRMLVFGGYDGASALNDVWTLSLSGKPAWSTLNPAGTPPEARWGHTAIYNPLRDLMVVFGGVGRRVWTLSLSGDPAWTALDPSGNPPSARIRHSAIYDPAGDRMVVFGGGTNGAYLNDVAALTWTAVLGRNDEMEKRLYLGPARPNPSAGSIAIDLELPMRGHVVLDIYDAQGRRVKRIENGEVDAGRRTWTWHGRDETGRPAPSGLYFVRVATPGWRRTQKALLIR